MCAKKVVEKVVETDQTMCGELRYTYSTAELVAKVCVMYLFRRRTCWQSVRDVLILAQNFLSKCVPECVQCTYSLYRRGALCTGFTLVFYKIGRTSPLFMGKVGPFFFSGCWSPPSWPNLSKSYMCIIANPPRYFKNLEEKNHVIDHVIEKVVIVLPFHVGLDRRSLHNPFF
jgi:hypothetical protein